MVTHDTNVLTNITMYRTTGPRKFWSTLCLVLYFTTRYRHCFQCLRVVATSSGWFKNYISRRPYGGAALVVGVRTKKIWVHYVCEICYVQQYLFYTSKARKFWSTLCLVLYVTTRYRYCFQCPRMVATSSGWFKNCISRRPYGGAALVVGGRTKKIWVVGGENHYQYYA